MMTKTAIDWIIIVVAIVAVGLVACSDDGTPPADAGEDDDNHLQGDAGDAGDLDSGHSDIDSGQGDDAGQDAGDDDADVEEGDVGDAGSDDDAGTDNDAEPLEPGGFGDWCGLERECSDEYICFQRDGEPRGVCTRHCDSPGQNCLGIPAPNTRPKCHYELEAEQWACAFVCLLDHGDHVHIYDCPPELECQTVDWSTNHYCR